MGLIPDDIIAQILDRCDIVELISEYVTLKKAGRNFKACCPFHHEKTPSFVVNRDKQIYHCFGCGAGGNAIGFLISHDHMDFPSAVRHLAQKTGISIPDTQSSASPETLGERDMVLKANELAVDFFHDSLMRGQGKATIAQEYLKKRQVKLDTAKKLKLGFAPDSWDGIITFLRSKNMNLSVMEKAGLIVPREKSEGYYDRFRDRVIFPIFDLRGKCIAFGGRTMKAESGAKYMNSPETPVYAKREHLYGLHASKQAIARDDHAVVVEGYMDFLTPFQAGVENIVASLGTALTIEQIRLIRRYTRNVIMLYDADMAGQMATVRSLDLLIEEDMHVKIALLASNEDPDSFIQKFGVQEFRQRLSAAQPLFDYKLGILLRQHDGRSVEGKARISAEMLTTLAKYRNEVVRSEYLKQLAHALSVSEDALRLELKKIGVTPTAEPSIYVRQHKKIIRVVERDLLRLILEDQEAAVHIQDEVTLEDFQDEQVRSVMAQIFHLSQHEKTISVAHLVQYFKDDETLRFLSELAAASHLIAGDKESLKRDYINRIKLDRLKSQRKNLCDEIQQAERVGDHQRLEELKQKFNQLIKG